jgi:hypothetical protein
MTFRRRNRVAEREPNARRSDATAEPGRLRRGGRWVREIVHQIHAGEDDMRAVYGDNPNGRPDAERIAGAAALSNLGNMSGGGAGGSF